jgi:CheY-like chemotaxis protein
VERCNSVRKSFRLTLTIGDETSKTQSTIINAESGEKHMIRILLVEDNAVFRESLKQSISSHFPKVVIEEAASGEDALQKVNGNPPHLISMDLRLPGINGLQTTRPIKSAFPNIRIVMLTGYDIPEYREAALINRSIIV